MTNVVRLGDPEIERSNEECRAFFYGRANAVLSRELGAQLDNSEVAKGLAEIARHVQAGAFPCVIRPSGLTEIKRGFDDLRNEGRKLSALCNAFTNHLNSASLDVQLEIASALEARGVDENTLNAVFEAIEAAGKRIAETAMPDCVSSVRQGRNPDTLHAWVLFAWPSLRAAGLGMRPAARVCSYVFTGSDDMDESFYQTIRNSSR